MLPTPMGDRPVVQWSGMRKLAILALSLLGWFDSAFLWWMYASPSHPMVCIGGGCDVVRASSYAYWWGIPLPAAGVAMYVVLALLIFVEPLFGARWTRLSGYAVCAISGAGFLFSLFLMGVSEFQLHAWCVWCVISALTVSTIFALALLGTLRPSARPEEAEPLVILRRYVAAFMVAILLGVPAFILLSRAEAVAPVVQAPRSILQERLLRPNTHFTGNPNAAVTVVEFGDFQCPACGPMEQTMRKIRLNYGGRVRFAFRHYPIPALHANAEKAAEASECAGAQGKFWQAYEEFYDHQDDLTVPALELYAGQLGLNKAEFDACLSSGAMAARVAEDKADAHALGVDRTPFFFVDGHMVVGARDYDEFAKILDQELNAKGGLATNAAAPQGTDEKPPGGNGASSSMPAPAGKSPVSSTSSSGAGLLGNPSANIFASSGGSLAACSEEEAAKQQPVMIDTAQARQFLQDGSQALFVDVRPAREFQRARIPGAINIPLDDIEKNASKLPKDRAIVVYESGAKAKADDICASGRAAGRFLLGHGFSYEHVRVYLDGLKSWEKAGLPVQHGQP
jgi:protein-disulfide isomerase/rhodanese-related sulfurtransferase